MNKREIRQTMLEKRNALTVSQKMMYDDQITERLVNSHFYQNMTNICVYQSFRNEVSCDRITESAFRAGKCVFVPVTDRKSRTMEFYPITPDTTWVEGAYGILEPVLEENASRLTEKALILMPGLAFDREKHRIGYGGGYYDRYLAKHPGHVTAALCYHFQVMEETLPYAEYDRAPDHIITDKELYH